MRLLHRSALCARRVLPVALCALGAHATLYRSILPADGRHAYLGWYVSAVAVASFAAVLLVLALAAASFRGGARARRVARALLPDSSSPLARSGVRLALASLAVLLVQESLEQSAALGRL